MDDDQASNKVNGGEFPPEDQLRKRAQYIWSVLKFFFSGIFLIFALMLGFVFYWLFHAFGVGGVIIGGVMLAAALVALCRHLLTY